MSILINGMEMPRTYPITVEIYPNGTVLSKTVGRMDIHGKADPVPPHGRLIDADELFKEMERKGWFDNADRDKAEDLVLDAPTIIPAEEGE